MKPCSTMTGGMKMLINHAKVGDTAGRRGIVFFLALMERSWSTATASDKSAGGAEGCADQTETA